MGGMTDVTTGAVACDGGGGVLAADSVAAGEGARGSEEFADVWAAAGLASLLRRGSMEAADGAASLAPAGMASWARLVPGGVDEFAMCGTTAAAGFRRAAIWGAA